MIQQQWNADAYQEHASFVPELGHGILEWLNPQNGELILDLGCGDGALTVKIREKGAAVVGLEPDSSMVYAARERSLEVFQLDAHDLKEKSKFDAVFSNAALHWMRKPEVVIQNVFESLKNNGRFIAEQGGFGNVAAISTALYAALRYHDIEPPVFPWDFPTVDQQKQRLAAAGFKVMKIEIFSRPTLLSTGMLNWFETFAGPFLQNCSTETRLSILKFAVSALENNLKSYDGKWFADYVRLRFWAVKSSGADAVSSPI